MHSLVLSFSVASAEATIVLDGTSLLVACLFVVASLLGNVMLVFEAWRLRRLVSRLAGEVDTLREMVGLQRRQDAEPEDGAAADGG
jgi:hypothetical protein